MANDKQAAPSDEPILTVSQAIAVIKQSYSEAPVTEAVRLLVGAKIARDENAERFWSLVADRLSFL
jgi:hypothetical protein